MLVAMPPGAIYQPNIGLSLLKSSIADRLVSCEIKYFTFTLVERIGSDLYQKLFEEQLNQLLVGEWIFAGQLFPDSGQEDAYVNDILSLDVSEFGHYEPIDAALTETILSMRRDAAAIIEECLHDIRRKRPRIVGFSSTFQQHTASLALATAIKREFPDTIVLMGGANCDSVMGPETVRQFDCVDAIVVGEADLIFPELIDRLLDGKPVDDMQGVFTQANVHQKFAIGQFGGGPRVTQMDDLPYPDFSDFYRQFEKADFEKPHRPDLLLETSRGCWWGAKSHCTFCGLNSDGMAYRSKSQERALAEFKHLTETYPGLNVKVVDNILDLSYFQKFLPQLAAMDHGISIFYETKANLKKPQIELLANAGVTMLQPGFETFSTDILSLMGKGITSIRNLQVLKWTREFEIRAYWAWIYGFPGEEAEAYTEMARMVPLISHLTPPGALVIIHLERFSPYFDYPERYGLTDVSAYPAYSYVYPFSEEVLTNLAYYFDYDFAGRERVSDYVRPLHHAVQQWRDKGESSALFFTDFDQEFQIWDMRPELAEYGDDSGAGGENSRFHRYLLSEMEANLYKLCDEACSLSRLTRKAHEAGIEIDEQEVKRCLQPLLKAGLLLQRDNAYLSLALPLTAYKNNSKVISQYTKMLIRGEPAMQRLSETVHVHA